MSIFVDMCNKATEICREMGNDAPNEIVLKMLLEELSDDEREKFEQERLRSEERRVGKECGS